ncbi:hypothetical protein [Arthrobacter luteolus]|uniref:hypothetical protein n=1 Tax=Arthrobacter luteolus TaxID=98672 RepID=UPI00384CEDE3
MPPLAGEQPQDLVELCRVVQQASRADAAVLSLALAITALRQPSDPDPTPGGQFV